jgi:hypothetical protein
MQLIPKRFFLIAVTFLAAAGLGFAQSRSGNLQATARANPAEIQLGQSAAIILEANGCDGRPEIQLPSSDDCFISFAGRLIPSHTIAGLNAKSALGASSIGMPAQNLAESIQKLTDKLANDPLLNADLLKGGNDPDLQKQLKAALGNLGTPRGDDRALVYHVHAKRTGTIVIPPFTVKANGETAATKPVELKVTPTRSQDLVRLALSLSNPRPVVGQEVRLNIDVQVRREPVTYANQTYPHLPLKGVQLTLPPLDLGPMEPVKALDEILKEHAPGAGHHGYRVNHLPSEAVFDKESGPEKGTVALRIEGQSPFPDPLWYRRRLEVPVRFQQTGKISMPMAGVAGESWVPGAAGGNAPARRLVGRWQPFVATSDPLAIEVRDLPVSRPHDFSGNIGALKVEANADQSKMPAGTPFTLTVRLEGEGYLPHPGSLHLADDPEFTRRFRVLANNDRALSDTLREVTYTLRPLGTNVKEVPPVAVTYFDSKVDEFKTARSPAIPLDVTGPAISSEDSGLSQAALDPGQADLLPLEDLRAAHQRGFFRRNFLPGAALAAAFALVAGVFIGGWRRRTARRLRANKADRAADSQRQQAAGVLRQQLVSRVQTAHDVHELVQQALRARFDLPPGEITPKDAAERLCQLGVDGKLAHACANLLKTCAAAEFAPGVPALPLPELAAEAERLLAQLMSALPAKGQVVAVGANATS